MRISCNGCRVLRKGCSDDCSIRPCLEWIKSPESQANATVFLAKFYGRAGLLNLINAGHRPLRPAIFRSLLYEACGRIVNPVYGSVGLVSSGNWQLCQTAVEAILKGSPIVPLAVDDMEPKDGAPSKAYDIRHVNKEGNLSGSGDLHRATTRCSFKRSAAKPKRVRAWIEPVKQNGRQEVLNRSPSHESSLSHQSEPVVETVSRMESASDRRRSDVDSNHQGSDDGEIELDLTLGFEPVKRRLMAPVWN